MKTHRLTENEARILVSASNAADRSVKEIAKSAGVKYRTVHTALMRMQAASLITPYWLISSDKLGLIDWCLFLSVEFRGARDRIRFHKFITTSSAIAYAAELSGEYNYSISFFGRSTSDVSAFLERVTKELSPSSFTRTMATRLSWITYPPTFLSTKVKEKRSFIERGSGESAPLDAVDQRLLSQLSTHPHASAEEYARTLGLSRGAIYYRLKSLRERGVLLGKLLLVNSNALGLYSYRLLIKEQGAERVFFERLQAYCLHHPNITALVRCIGAWDYEINIELADSGELNAFVADIQEHFYRSIHSIVTVSLLKVLRLSQYPFPSR